MIFLFIVHNDVSICSDMAGEAAPTDWQGGLNFTYHIGPGFKQTQRHVQMFVSTHTQSARVYNAFGVIEGSVEPGEAVV